jgi:hypothetical protein
VPTRSTIWGHSMHRRSAAPRFAFCPAHRPAPPRRPVLERPARPTPGLEASGTDAERPGVLARSSSGIAAPHSRPARRRPAQADKLTPLPPRRNDRMASPAGAAPRGPPDTARPRIICFPVDQSSRRDRIIIAPVRRGSGEPRSSAIGRERTSLTRPFPPRPPGQVSTPVRACPCRSSRRRGECSLGLPVRLIVLHLRTLRKGYGDEGEGAWEDG